MLPSSVQIGIGIGISISISTEEHVDSAARAAAQEEEPHETDCHGEEQAAHEHLAARRHHRRHRAARAADSLGQVRQERLVRARARIG